MSVFVRPLRPDDAPALAALADEFADYLRALGDSGPHRLTAEAIVRDGFGPRPAFVGLVAAEAGGADESVTAAESVASAEAGAADESVASGGAGASGLAGYLLYTLGYDADLAARNLMIIDLYVSPAARRQGTGRALLAAALDACRAAGGAYLYWAVLVGNQLAVDFYTALGARYVQDLDYMLIDLPAGKG